MAWPGITPTLSVVETPVAAGLQTRRMGSIQGTIGVFYETWSSASMRYQAYQVNADSTVTFGPVSAIVSEVKSNTAGQLHWVADRVFLALQQEASTTFFAQATLCRVEDDLSITILGKSQAWLTSPAYWTYLPDMALALVVATDGIGNFTYRTASVTATGISAFSAKQSISFAEQGASWKPDPLGPTTALLTRAVYNGGLPEENWVWDVQAGTLTKATGDLTEYVRQFADVHRPSQMVAHHLWEESRLIRHDGGGALTRVGTFPTPAPPADLTSLGGFPTFCSTNIEMFWSPGGTVPVIADLNLDDGVNWPTPAIVIWLDVFGTPTVLGVGVPVDAAVISVNQSAVTEDGRFVTYQDLYDETWATKLGTVMAVWTGTAAAEPVSALVTSRRAFIG